MLLFIFTLRRCSAGRAKRTSSGDQPAHEAVYEEINDAHVKTRPDSEVQSWFLRSAVVDSANISTPTSPALYSTVNKLKADRPNNQDSIYVLAQNPSPDTSS